jgi:hypothetical protein
MPRTKRSKSAIWLLLCVAAVLAGCATGGGQRTAQLCAVAAVPGCSTAAQQQEQRSAAVTTEALARFKTCALTVWGRPEFNSLLVHTADPETGQATRAQLRDGKRPSPAEVKLLITAYDDSTPCRTQVLMALLPARPDIVPILTSTFAKARVVAILLDQRKITWGDAARRGQRRLKDLQQEVSAADRRWVAELNASNDAETTQRQTAATAMLRYSVQQQITKPRSTSCHGSVNCTFN